MTQRIATYGGSVPGSSAYWWKMGACLGSAVRRRVFWEGRSPVLFFSLTNAIHKWALAWRILSMAATFDGAHPHNCRQIAEGVPSSVHQALASYPALANELCLLRAEVFVDEVFKVGMGLDEAFYKHEFGKHGRWHIHGLAHGGVAADLLQDLLDRVLRGVFAGVHKDGWSMGDLVDLELSAAGAAGDSIHAAFGDAVTAGHPAGGARSVVRMFASFLRLAQTGTGRIVQ